MVRPKWKGTLAAALLSGSMAWGQQAFPAADTPNDHFDSVITVCEPGKKSQKCRILKSWSRQDGMTSYEAQDIETGEKITICETGTVPIEGASPSSHERAITTQLFHWGNSTTPPPSAPLPPDESDANYSASTVAPAQIAPGAGSPSQNSSNTSIPGDQVIYSETALPESTPGQRGCQSIGGTGGCCSNSMPMPPLEAQVVERKKGIFSRMLASRSSSGPVIMQETPVVVQQQPAIVKDQPIMMQEQPVLVQEQPVTIKDQPIVMPQTVMVPQTSGGVAVPSNPGMSGSPVIVEEKKGFLSRIFSRQGVPASMPSETSIQHPTTAQMPASATPSPAVPNMQVSAASFPVAAPALKIDAAVAKTPTNLAAPYKPPQIATLDQSNDWHDSWGKANDHKSQQPVFELPHADMSHADPLKDPVGFKPFESTKEQPGVKADVSKFLPDTSSPAATTASLASTSGSADNLHKDLAFASSVKPATANPSAGAGKPAAQTKPENAHKDLDFAQGLKNGADQARPTSFPPSDSNTAGKTAGSQSVLASGAGQAGRVVYVPIPLMTVPPVQTMPVPPAARVPQPPQPTAPRNRYDSYVNSVARPGSSDPSNEASNAFTEEDNSGPTEVANAFSPKPAQNEPIKDASYFQHGNAPMPGTNPMAGAAAAQMAAARAGYLPGSVYAAGGINPNAMASRGQQVACVGPGAGVSRVAEPASLPVIPAAASDQMLVMLRDAPYPSHREWVAECLCNTKSRDNPNVVPALLKAAAEDPAATVRAACVRCLVKMNVSDIAVSGTIQALRTDPDPRVRQEAEIAAVRFAAMPSVAPNN